MLPVALDVTDPDCLADAVEQSVQTFGGIDITFANAGIAAASPRTVFTSDPSEFERIVEVDLLGVFRTVRATLPQIVTNQGHVLVTASVYAYFNGTINAAYAMSKAGVEQFGRALRTELAVHGATAGVLYPGWVRTPIAQSAFGGNDLVTEMRRQLYPRFLAEAIAPETVAARIVGGLESRSPRIMVPRRWAPISTLRGVVNPLTDWALERNSQLRKQLRQLEQTAQPTVHGTRSL